MLLGRGQPMVASTMGHHIGNISDRMVDPYADVSTTFLQFNITLSIITTSIAIPGNMALIIIFIAFRYGMIREQPRDLFSRQSK